MLTKVLIDTGNKRLPVVAVLGFLKFLKREKKKEGFDELDFPPSPPPLEGFEDNIDMEFPELDEENISGKSELPKFDFSEKGEGSSDSGKDEKMPDFPSFPEFEERPMPPIPPIRAPTSIPEAMPLISEHELDGEQKAAPPEFAPQTPYKEQARSLFPREKKNLREMPSGKTLYIRIDKFKSSLGSINNIKSDLRKSEDALTKLENMKNAKDRSFERVRASLDDLQKKLIFIDKTLFKGE